MVLREASARHAPLLGGAQAFGILRAGQRHTVWVWRRITAGIEGHEQRRGGRCGTAHC
jgi:hypothetical protein